MVKSIQNEKESTRSISIEQIDSKVSKGNFVTKSSVPAEVLITLTYTYYTLYYNICQVEKQHISRWAFYLGKT